MRETRRVEEGGCARRGRLGENKAGVWVRERERRGVNEGEECNACFGKWFTEKNFVTRFPFFSKGFFGQCKWFVVSLLFYSETNTRKL